MASKKFARVYTAQPHILKGEIISVEVAISTGMHAFHIVGMAGKSVDEARSRVGAALNNCEYASPKHANKKTVIALAPAELHKNGSRYDVAIAVGYLIAEGILHVDPEKKLFLGELSLDGHIRPVTGCLALAKRAKEEGFKELYIPRDNVHEAACIEGITIYPCDHIVQVCQFLDPEHECEGSHDYESLAPYDGPSALTVGCGVAAPSQHPCFSEVKGQALAKRGLMIAAAGRHNVALYGPPGTGKTMLAKAFTGILPPLSREHMLEVIQIHSIAGKYDGEISTTPPLRSPHHTASYVSIIGGGSIPQPGEVTLAHNGVLFLDEFPEFDNRVIESLRQPLEDKVVHISRARSSASFPADCIIVAALNPCPCGFFGTKVKACVCAPYQLDRYQKKLSGPIVDRIDIWLPVEHIDYEHFHKEVIPGQVPTSDELRAQIDTARVIQNNRQGRTNNRLRAKDLHEYKLSKEVQDLMMASARAMNLSPRSYHRVLKIARTIADLDSRTDIKEDDILEALQYRPKINYSG